MQKLSLRLILIFFLFCQIGFGQDMLFNTRHLTVENGLLGRRVNSIVQDDEGFIWIGTNEGLNRYDGYEFQHFTQENFGLSSNRIEVLRKDDQGNIWIDYVQDEYKKLPIQVLNIKKRTVISMEDYLGKFFQTEFEDLAIMKSKPWETPFFIYKDKNKQEHFHQYISDKGIVQLPKGFECYTPDGKGYWISNRSTAILKDNNGKTIERLSVPDYHINKIVYISTKWLFLLVSQKNQTPIIIKKKIGEPTYEILGNNVKKSDVFPTAAWLNDSIYIPYEDSILSIDNSSMMLDELRFLFVDKNQDTWIGSSNGVYILSHKKNPFTVYFKNAVGNSGYSTRGIWANQDFLYSFAPKAVLRWNFKTQQQETLPLSNKGVARRSNSQYLNRQIWTGANRGFPVEQLDTLSGKVLQSLALPFKAPIWSILETQNQELWIGANKGGLYQYRPTISPNIEPFNKYNGFDDLKKGKIIHLVEDKKDPNLIWVAAQAGWFLVHTSKGVITRFSLESHDDFKIPSNDIYYTYQPASSADRDNDGVYWLGTAFGGLLRVTLTNDFKVKNVQQFTTKDGFSSKTIYGIFEDKNGFLWLSSNNGIIKFNKTTFDVQVFLMEDGLSHYEFNRNSAFQRRDGTIFFGTLNGIVGFHPDEIETKTTYDIPLKISKCEKYSKKIDDIVDITKNILTKNKIVLQPNERFFTLSVSLQDYSDAPKLKYAYKIIGLQNDFTITKDNKITLSGLPYGRYTLHIKGQGKDSRFSIQELKIPLVVLRPFYLTWWFLLSIVFLLALLIWQFLIWRIRNLKNNQLVLEKIVAERTHQITKDKAIIQEQATKLEALDKVKSRFFANISHELRTPLTLILSPINSMMQSQKLDNRNFTYAALVQQNAKKLLKRINEILDLTKLEAQEMQLKPAPTNFYHFTKRLIATFESFAQQKKQELTFKYDLDKDLQILLDQDKFEHIFNNYLSNAIKYAAENGKINISLTEKSINLPNGKNENQIVLAVKDNGIGIPKEDLNNIFERFYQVKNATNKTGGTGIGLALCKEIAQLMNGIVHAKSTIGEGSVFYFQMPYQEFLGVINGQLATSLTSLPVVNLRQTGLDRVVSNQQLTISKERIEIEPLVTNNKRATILLVEDNTQLRQYIQLILSDKYNIITAKNGKEALEKLRITNSELRMKNDIIPNSKFVIPNLIISDIMMPVMDGFELLEQLKASDKWRHIPVIMLTARTNIQTRLDALRIGVDDYLLKPFEEIELKARIENILKNIEQRQAIIPTEAAANKKVKHSEHKKEIIITEGDTKWLQQVEQTLKKELSNSKFNAIELANLLHLSRRQLQRRIKKTTGLTPAQYIKEARLQSARQLLESGALPTVNEITFAVGFDTAWYFSKQYEERFGKKPIEYLK